MRSLWLAAAWFAAFAVLCTSATYAARAWLRSRAAPGPEEERLGALVAARAFLVECGALATNLLALPFGWLLRHRPTKSGRAPVILVHCWGLNPGCWWLLRRRLARAGWGPIVTFGYSSWYGDIDAAAMGLRQVVDNTAHENPGKPLTLVGHGAGGLVIRCFLRRYPAPQVRRLVTLGTPHLGTVLALLPGPMRSLLPGSALLNALNSGDRLPQQFDIIAIHSSFDAMVLPADSAYYPEAFNVRVNDVGHNALLLSRKVFGLLAENLAAPLVGR